MIKIGCFYKKKPLKYTIIKWKIKQIVIGYYKQTSYLFPCKPVKQDY